MFGPFAFGTAAAYGSTNFKDIDPILLAQTADGARTCRTSQGGQNGPYS